ncbi:glycoside hydrolase family 108 protein [Ancylobacter dichloromethanicus]|nr:glycosyl hydrolase 108 family protein [Ancylobacter dichloromethanicus]MBS7553871.1 glycoside hydrolase family 108 protein [Ancylobacter dichloromethanicus]
MNPLVVLAGSLLPEILKLAFGPRSGPIIEAVSNAVEAATGTKDPQKAQAQLAADPKLASELKLELARIAAQGEEAQRQGELEALRLTIERESRAAASDLAQRERDDKDRAGARDTFLALASARNPLAWAPVVISIVIVVGFFWILWVLLQPLTPDRQSPFTSNAPLLQLINIVIGGLVSAFATVVSYHLGSSASSRAKDTASFELQGRFADQAGTAIRAQVRQAEEMVAGRPAGASPASEAARTDAAAARFQACLEIVFGGEGGFSNDTFDPGGATKFGITIRTLSAYRGEEASVDDVAKLTKEEARDIYRSMYWNVMKCEQLPPGVDLVVFDHGVNAGPARAVKMLQSVVGTAPDGSIGPVTLEATRRRDAVDIVRRLSQARRDFYEGLDKARFEKGWINRANKVEQLALGMASAQKAA